MNAIGLVIGCILIAVGFVMHANRAGYVYFVIGPGTVFAVAGIVAILAGGFWLAAR